MAHMVAADRFALDQLKHLCKAKLCEELNVDVVAKILSFAHDHHCSQLKTFGVDFAVANLRGLRDTIYCGSKVYYRTGQDIGFRRGWCKPVGLRIRGLRDTVLASKMKLSMQSSVIYIVGARCL